MANSSASKRLSNCGNVTAMRRGRPDTVQDRTKNSASAAWAIDPATTKPRLILKVLMKMKVQLIR
jgi:hypothetical protein